MSKLSKWDPREWFESKWNFPMNRSDFLSPFYNFQQEVDNLFKKFYHSMPFPSPNLNQIEINPALDIIEDEQNYKIELEMAGVDEKDVKVSIDNDILVIQAHREISSKDEGKNYVVREIGYGTYERKIQLPNNVDVNRAESSFKKGMLWVNIPKKAIDKSKIKEIEVKKVLG